MFTVMIRGRRGRVRLLVAIVSAGAAVLAAVVLGANSVASARSVSGQVRLTLHLNQPSGGSPSGDGQTTPSDRTSSETGGSSGAGRVKGRFSIRGVLHDAGSVRLRSGGDATSALIFELSGKRGLLRLAVRSGTASLRSGSWRIASGTRTYAHLLGSGRATLSPPLIVLVGRVHSD